MDLSGQYQQIQGENRGQETCQRKLVNVNCNKLKSDFGMIYWVLKLVMGKYEYLKKLFLKF